MFAKILRFLILPGEISAFEGDYRAACSCISAKARCRSRCTSISLRCAMLALYGNPMAIIVAAVTVALHHLLLWLILPSSVIGSRK